MNIFQRPDGLFVAEEHDGRMVSPKPEEMPDASMALPGANRKWLEGLHDGEKEELLAFLPKLFLRAHSVIGLDREVRKLMARAEHLSGHHFEVFT